MKAQACRVQFYSDSFLHYVMVNRPWLPTSTPLLYTKAMNSPGKRDESESSSSLPTSPPTSLPADSGTPSLPTDEGLEHAGDTDTDGMTDTEGMAGAGESLATTPLNSANADTRDLANGGDGPATLPDSSDVASAARPRRLRFRVLKAHAEGGLGRVSIARDIDLQRNVAVKEIKDAFADRPESRARFLFEAEVTGRLEHPGVVPVYALGHSDDGRPYYAMRFISGVSMKKAIKDLHQLKGEAYRLELRKLLGRFVSVCNTVAYAHQHGIIHRDLKPDNIMIGEYGETLVVDWGMARLVAGQDHENLAPGQSLPIEPAIAVAEEEEESGPHESGPHESADTDPLNHFRGSDGSTPQADEFSRLGNVVGTPPYMPPEQASGQTLKVTACSDIYSLGATLMHLLTGAPPFSEHPRDQILAKVREGDFRTPRQVRPGVSRSLEAICLHAMAKDRDARYPTARDLAADVERWLADEKVSVADETMFQTLGRWTRKNRSIAATSAVALVLITVISLLFSSSLKQSLDRTSRLLTIANIEQEFDELLRESQQASLGGADTAPHALDPKPVQEMTDLLQRLESLGSQPQRVVNRRQRLLDAWTASIQRLTRVRMTDEAAEELESEVSRLNQNFPWQDDSFQQRVKQLRVTAADRIGQWYPLASPPPSDSFDTGPNGALLRRLDDNDEWPVALGDCPPGNLRLDVTFASNWRDARYLTLWINRSDQESYEMVIADATFDPRYPDINRGTLGDSADRGALAMLLVRHKRDIYQQLQHEVLRMQPIEVEGPLRMRLSRSGVTSLRMSVGDLEDEPGATTLDAAFRSTQDMVFTDLFPLLSSDPGDYGVTCPPNQRLSVQLERQRSDNANQEATPEIERGDILFANNDLTGAREAYNSLPGDQEAQVKLALTYQREDPDEYVRLLTRVRDNLSPTLGTQSSRQWYLYAGVLLLNQHFARSDDYEVQITITLDKLKSQNYRLQEIAELIPEQQREVFVSHLVKPGQRFRIAFDNVNDVTDLEDAIDFIELFSNNPEWARGAKWRLADAWRCRYAADAGEGRRKAIALLEELVVEVGQLKQPNYMELTALISDLVWVYNLEGMYDKSLELINAHWDADGEQRSELWPLLLDRARVHYQQAGGDPSETDEAIADLEEFFRRVSPKKEIPGIHYSHYTEASAMLAIMWLDRGEARKAERVWKRGRLRNWHEGLPDPDKVGSLRGYEMVLVAQNAEPVLVAMPGEEYTAKEANNSVEMTFAGSGLGDHVIRNIVFNTQRLPDEWIRIASEKVYSGPRGMKVGRGKVFRTHGLAHDFTEGAVMILYQAVLHLAFEGEATLKKYPEADQDVHQQVTRIYELYQEGVIDQDDMGFVLDAFTGDVNPQTFRRFSRKIEEPQLSRGLALVFGSMAIKFGANPKSGEAMLQEYIFDNSDKVPASWTGLAKDVIDAHLKQMQDGT